MRKPIKLTSTSSTFSVNFEGNVLKKETTLSNAATAFQTNFNTDQPLNEEAQWSENNVSISVGFNEEQNINKDIEISGSTTNVDIEIDNTQLIVQPNPAAPDWNEKDPASPSYIWNKEVAEQYRPITIDGEDFLSEKRSSGALDIIAGEGVSLETDKNSVRISVGIPAATLNRLGLVRSSKEKNQISVNKETGVMEINSVSTDKLIQGEKELILNGGNTNFV